MVRHEQLKFFRKPRVIVLNRSVSSPNIHVDLSFRIDDSSHAGLGSWRLLGVFYAHNGHFVVRIVDSHDGIWLYDGTEMVCILETTYTVDANVLDHYKGVGPVALLYRPADDG